MTFTEGQRVRVVSKDADSGRQGTFEGEYGVHHMGGWVKLDGEADAEAFEYFELEAVERVLPDTCRQCGLGYGLHDPYCRNLPE